ncbi:MAG: M48 family metalloprotease, partial [Nitrospinaceae bacterium]
GMGEEAVRQVIAQYGLYQNKAIQLYVNEIGQKLISRLSNPEFSNYFFKVLDSSEINAFALPGGYIYITRGILAVMNDEAELAGVLGHEIGHVVFHHAAKNLVRTIGAQILALGGVIASPQNAGPWLAVSTQLFTTINLGYGREAELESDAHGLWNAYEAGYDPKSAVSFFRTLRQQEIMTGQSYHSFQATHPDTRERIVKADSLADSILNRGSKTPAHYRARYLENIKGLVDGGGKSKKDKRAYKPEYIDIYEVKPGDTFLSIAENELDDPRQDLDIAVLNGMRLEDRPSPGTLLKIVREGRREDGTRLELQPDSP